MMEESIKQFAKQYLSKSGFSVRRHSPYLLQHPQSELPLSFPLVIAHHFLRTMPEPFFFIQVGAFDGVNHDPLNSFIKNLSWHGVLLEPQSAPFTRLQKTYADQPYLNMVQAAVSDSDGTKPFYTVRQDVDGIPAITQELASFNKETILSHKGIYADIENVIVTEQVRTVTFPTLLDTHHVEKIDLLQIDAEGYDFELLKMFPFEQVRPAIVHYEHKHLKQDIEASWMYLAERGYLIGVHPEDTTAYLQDLCPSDVTE